MQLFDHTTQVNLDAWLNGSYDFETKQKIQELLRENPKEAIDSFYTKLSFGTGGMRGLMGVGSNRMNKYTIQTATQGLANYLKKQVTGPLSALIGYDSRHFSKEFAENAARVFAGNGIHTYIFKDIRPTPLVSFGCRYKKCSTAIMITASHNPPEYNGYKVYWSDGGQVIPPHDIGIVEEVNKIEDISQVKIVDSIQHPNIEWVEDEIDDAYLSTVKNLSFYPKENYKNGKELKIVYSSLHGTGITLAPRALKLWGFPSLEFVDSQIIPNGDFPTVKFPNPEEKEALKLGIEKMLATKSDIFFATDPDADRIGVVVLHKKKPFIFNGNQMACLCLEHICKAMEEQNRLNEKTSFIKTIVTSELFKAIAENYNTHCFDVLTGFKYIAELIGQWEKEIPLKYEYIFGGEESYGYLLGSFERDKDAISACSLIAEMALQAKLQGKTLVDTLHDLYRKYGLYYENLISIKFEESKAGKEAMAQAMQSMRKEPLDNILGIPVAKIEDYQESIRKSMPSQKIENITLPKSNVLIYWLADGSKIMVRPSGTEPKIKVYCGVIQKDFPSIEKGEELASKRTLDFLKAIEQKC